MATITLVAAVGDQPRKRARWPGRLGQKVKHSVALGKLLIVGVVVGLGEAFVGILGGEGCQRADSSGYCDFENGGQRGKEEQHEITPVLRRQTIRRCGTNDRQGLHRTLTGSSVYRSPNFACTNGLQS